jgi:hypothetical protein
MIRHTLLLSVIGLFLSISILSAGEPEAIHLTGNPSVDLFGPASLNTAFSANHARSLFQDPVTQSDEEGRKSPALAGFMSLLVPGAGEVYTKNYIKGAVFFAAEAACWTVVAVYNKKGRDQETYYRDYANKHYSAYRYAEWLQSFIAAHYPDLSTTGLFQGTSDAGKQPPFTNVNWVVLNQLETDLGQQSAGFSHQLPFYGVQQYYELIGKYLEFMHGWDFVPIDNINLPAPEDRYKYQQLLDYADSFNQADRYYNIASSFVDVIVANHLLSALDAIWSASKYNNTLHAEVHMNLEPSPLGVIPVTRAYLEYRF